MIDESREQINVQGMTLIPVVQPGCELCVAWNGEYGVREILCTEVCRKADGCGAETNGRKSVVWMTREQYALRRLTQ